MTNAVKENFIRFFSKIEKTGTCWNWKAGTCSSGYGVFAINRVKYAAHRWFYQELYGPVGKNIVICHACDNRRCVNPDHLFPGTQSDNVRDCVVKDRHIRGEKASNAKLNDSQVVEMRRLHSRGLPMSSLAEKFGVSPSRVAKIIKGQAWRHLLSGGVENGRR